MLFSSDQTREWWRRTGSNRRPQACKASALPTELRPRSFAALAANYTDGPCPVHHEHGDRSGVGMFCHRRQIARRSQRVSDRIPRERSRDAGPSIMVGLGRLELPTSRLSGVRSNHLSYRPDLSVRWSHKRKRNEDGDSPALSSAEQAHDQSQRDAMNTCSIV